MCVKAIYKPVTNLLAFPEKLRMNPPVTVMNSAMSNVLDSYTQFIMPVRNGTVVVGGVTTGFRYYTFTGISATLF